MPRIDPRWVTSRVTTQTTPNCESASYLLDPMIGPKYMSVKLSHIRGLSFLICYHLPCGLWPTWALWAFSYFEGRIILLFVVMEPFAAPAAARLSRRDGRPQNPDFSLLSYWFWEKDLNPLARFKWTIGVAWSARMWPDWPGISISRCYSFHLCGLSSFRLV